MLQMAGSIAKPADFIGSFDNCKMQQLGSVKAAQSFWRKTKRREDAHISAYSQRSQGSSTSMNQSGLDALLGSHPNTAK